MAHTPSPVHPAVAALGPLGEPAALPDPERVATVLIRAATRVLEAEGALRRLSSDWINVHTSPRS